jgi:hypothetical protein
MALKEYLQDLLGVTNSQLLGAGRAQAAAALATEDQAAALAKLVLAKKADIVGTHDGSTTIKVNESEAERMINSDAFNRQILLLETKSTRAHREVPRSAT